MDLGGCIIQPRAFSKENKFCALLFKSAKARKNEYNMFWVLLNKSARKNEYNMFWKRKIYKNIR
jgi:hypothetical protein